MTDHQKLREAIALLRSPHASGQPVDIYMTAVSVLAEHLAEVAESVLPRTKMVEVWRVEWASRSDAFGKWLCLNHTFVGSDAEKNARERAETWAEDYPNARCIRVTGPHQQEVPDEQG